MASAVSCAWTATSPVPWVTVIPADGVGSRAVRIDVQRHTGTSTRTATLSVAGRAVEVVQRGANSAVAQELRLEGTVSQVTGTCPALTFRLQGRTVVTSATTNFVANRCSRVRSGTEVEVRGQLQPNGEVHATRVKLDEDE